MRVLAQCRRFRIGVVIPTLVTAPTLFGAYENAGGVTRPSTSIAGPTVSPGLCSSISSLDRLTVSRVDAFAKNHFHFAFPSLVTVTDVTAVHEVAKALCALPKMPSGALHCPADWGISYHLAFAAQGHTYPAVRVDATGCQGVTGLGHSRWTARSPEFWHVLGKSMGLANPGHAVFAGTRSIT